MHKFRIERIPNKIRIQEKSSKVKKYSRFTINKGEIRDCATRLTPDENSTVELGWVRDMVSTKVYQGQKIPHKEKILKHTKQSDDIRNKSERNIVILHTVCSWKCYKGYVEKDT